MPRPSLVLFYSFSFDRRKKESFHNFWSSVIERVQLERNPTNSAFRAFLQHSESYKKKEKRKKQKFLRIELDLDTKQQRENNYSKLFARIAGQTEKQRSSWNLKLSTSERSTCAIDQGKIGQKEKARRRISIVTAAILNDKSLLKEIMPFWDAITIGENRKDAAAIAVRDPGAAGAERYRKRKRYRSRLAPRITAGRRLGRFLRAHGASSQAMGLHA